MTRGVNLEFNILENMLQTTYPALSMCFFTWIPLVAYDRNQIQSGLIQKRIIDYVDEKFQRLKKNPKYKHL